MELLLQVTTPTRALHHCCDNFTPPPAENADFMVNDNVIIIPASNNIDFRTATSSLISMTLLDDLAVEGVETVELRLESVDPERIMVQEGVQPIILTITDNDRKWMTYLTVGGFVDTSEADSPQRVARQEVQ